MGSLGIYHIVITNIVVFLLSCGPNQQMSDPSSPQQGQTYNNPFQVPVSPSDPPVQNQGDPLPSDNQTTATSNDLFGVGTDRQPGTDSIDDTGPGSVSGDQSGTTTVSPGQELLFAENPPDSFQVYAGAVLVWSFMLADIASNNEVSYSIEKGSSSIASIDGSGLFNLAPKESNIGQTISFTVSASLDEDKVNSDFSVTIFDPKIGMIAGDTFYIDPFECAVSFSADCRDDSFYAQSDGQDDYPPEFSDDIGVLSSLANGGTRFYACSRAGIKPSRYITFAQANQACKNVGKRLCTYIEHVLACAGTKTESCNWNGGDTIASGSMQDCKSDIGVFDLLGNLKEWTNTLQCNPLDSSTNAQDCIDECVFSRSKEWCNESGNISLFRKSKSEFSDGYLLPGGFYKVNGKDYAACGGYAYERLPALSTQSSTGFRCCLDM